MRIIQLFLALCFASAACTQGTETFTNVPNLSSTSTYLTRTWIGDGGVNWSSTDTRSDQTITGKAIGIRSGALTSGTIANGIGNLSFAVKFIFSGPSGSLTIKVNGMVVGTVAVASTQTTPLIATVPNINITGAFTLEIQQTVSGARVALDDVTWTSYASSSCTPPSAQASAVSFSNISANTFDVTWTVGNGTNSLVVVKAGSAVTGVPTNGTAYTANAAFGSGATISTGEYVVYNGTGNSVSVTALTAGTIYHVAVFTFNTAGNCYNTSSPARNNATTICTEPTVQVSSISINPATNTASVNWSGGNGNSSLVLLNTANSFTAPTDGTNYTSSASYTSGQQVMYSGNASSVSISGLTATTTYYVTVYTFNSCSSAPDYLTTGNITPSFTTTAGCGAGIPVGYYSTITTQTCAALKTELSNIISAGFARQNYGDFDNIHFLTTDDRLSDDGLRTIVWDMYSDNPAGADPYEFNFGQMVPGGFNQGTNTDGEGNGWNKEHSFPNSWFSASSSTNNDPGSDLHHIFPSDMDVNGLRGNYPFGKVASATTTTANGSKLGSSALAFSGYSGPVFEPIDAYKGDFARATLYMVTRYQSSQATWEVLQPGGDAVMDGTPYPSIEIDYLQMLLSWHAADPVSPKEIDRNNTVYCYQFNRNPFVDRPEFVSQIWNSGCGLLLPIELTKFDAQLTRTGVLLKWTAENAQGFSHFVIERSVGGSTYQPIGNVNWMSGVNTYSFNDLVTALSGKILYRLKMVDINGVFKYSKIAAVQLSATGTIYPNPASDNVIIYFNKQTTTATMVQIVDMYGRTIRSVTVPAGVATYVLSVNALPAARYIVRLVSNESVSNLPLMIWK